MALVLITGVRVMRCPNEGEHRLWQNLQAEFKFDIDFERFLDTERSRVETVLKDLQPEKREELLKLHQNAGRGFQDGFGFEITFECREPGLGEEELEWKLIYVGSAADEKFDQELDSVLVGPVTLGRNQFVFQGPGPNPDRIPDKDLMGVTVLLLTCSYKQKEFIRIGYFINNDLPEDLLQLVIGPPPTSVRPYLHELRRNIENATAPRVTKFNIDWMGDGKIESSDSMTDAEGQQQQMQQQQMQLQQLQIQQAIQQVSEMKMDTEMDDEAVASDEEDEGDDYDDEGDEGDEAEEEEKENNNLGLAAMNQNILALHTDSRYALPQSSDSKSHEGTSDQSLGFQMPRLP